MAEQVLATSAHDPVGLASTNDCTRLVCMPPFPRDVLSRYVYKCTTWVHACVYKPHWNTLRLLCRNSQFTTVYAIR